MCFWKKEQQIVEESRGLERDKIDDILDLIVGLSQKQFENLKAGMDLFYQGYNTIKGVKTPEDKKREKDQKEMQEIEDLDKKLEYEQAKETKK